ncbi:MAG: glycosyltransferase family 2 protein [Sphingomonadales bacterium]
MPLIEFALQVMAWLICAPLAVLLTIFVLEVSAGLVRRQDDSNALASPDTVIVMPAHNEAGGLEASLLALKAVLPEDIRVLLVADNCTDATAAIGRSVGIDVIERSDPVNRGKGFALAFARDHLSTSPPECVVILDADCIPIGDSINALRGAVARYDAPVQSTNLLRPDLKAAPMVQISNFAFLVKNLIRQRGAGRIGNVAVLGGTGMAMPWDFFASAPLASSDIVEDLSLGIYAVRMKRAPRFVERARVESAAAEGASALTQRTRWEHGFVNTAAKRALPLLLEGIRRRSLPHFWMGCHLCVPPLAMLCGLAGVGVVLLAGFGVASGGYVPAITLALLLAVALTLVLIVWLREGRGFLSAAALLRMPMYVLWKVPIYLKLFGKRESEWKRTKRSGE